MSGVTHLTVTEDEGDQRLDRYLRRHYPHLQQGRIEKMCRKGEIRVDSGRVKSSTRVEAGQMVRVPPIPAPEPDLARGEAPVRRITDEQAEMIRNCVIYKDAHVIALNKPAGLATQGGTNQTVHLAMLCDALCFEREDVPRLVHRLDKDTSGVICPFRPRGFGSGESLSKPGDGKNLLGRRCRFPPPAPRHDPLCADQDGRYRGGENALYSSG